MKFKLLKVILLLISISCICVFNNSYATSVGTIKGFFKPNNPSPGDEVIVQISSTQLNEGITTLSFNLEYDAEKLEFVSDTPTENWKLAKQENTYTLTTKDGNATTTIGEILTTKLKVKENAPISTSIIKITKLQLITEDKAKVSIGDISEEIKITAEEQKQQPEQQETKKDEQKTSDASKQQEEQKQQGNDKQQSDIEKMQSQDKYDESKIKTINGSTNKESTKSSDSSAATKNLPKTGESKISAICLGAILILAPVSFILLKKYKNI